MTELSPPAPRLMARSILSLGMLAARHLSNTMRKRGFTPGSPPASLAAMKISLLNLAKILARLASTAPLKCFTLAHLLCPAIILVSSPDLMDRLDLHGCAVAKNLGYPRRDFRRVVAHADDRVGAELVGVGDHVAKGVVARPFAQFGVDGDVAAEQTLDAGADVSDNRARADNNAADDAEILQHAIAGNFERRRSEWMCFTHKAVN